MKTKRKHKAYGDNAEVLESVKEEMKHLHTNASLHPCSKRCSKCKKWKSLNKFSENGWSRDGLQGQCKVCKNKYIKEYYRLNKTKRAEQQRKYSQSAKGKASGRIRTKKYKQSHKIEEAEYKRKQRKTIKGYLTCVFVRMNDWCDNINNPKHKNYKGKKIRCDFKSSREFCDYVIDVLGFDTYEKIKGLRLDRIDNNSHYAVGNIRFVNLSHKSMNRDKTVKPTTSRYKGVSWNKEMEMWAVSIGKDNVRFWGGRYEDEESAAYKYDEMALKYHGKHANTNFMQGLLS